uniref:Uncharacterized protein n=1 Tax=Rangifer tarandus platyrhynchus TaxID=3082113 RepID=A0ACB0FB50_RANTA|nr:unnamed protein product [Rangifer tarandus platyrhynchus]
MPRGGLPAPPRLIAGERGWGKSEVRLPGEPHLGEDADPGSVVSFGASVSLFCPLMHLPILLTAVPCPPEGSCPPGSLAFAFVSLPEGCWYRPPPQTKSFTSELSDLPKLTELENGRKLGPNLMSVLPFPVLNFFTCHQYAEDAVSTGLEPRKF